MTILPYTSLLALMIGCSTEILPAEKIETDEDTTSTEETAEETDDPSDNSSNDNTGSAPEDSDDDSGSNNNNDQDENTDSDALNFTKIELFTLPGSAWLQAADLNNDGYDEYLLSSMSAGVGDWPTFIGAGESFILSRDGGPADGTVGTWTATTIFDRSDEIDWPNDPALFDVNNDGIDDWIVGTGFIPLPSGGIVWMEGFLDATGSLTFDLPDYIDTPWTDHFYHKAYPVDMDNDGDMDFVTTNYRNPQKDWLGNETEPGLAVLEWYENDGIPGEASFTPHQISERGGALLALHDVDGDGDQDIIIPQYFTGASLIWMENPGTVDGTWNEYIINNNTGHGFDVELADMNGDGALDIVYGNHNHQLATDPEDQIMGIYWFEIPSADLLSGLSNWDSYMHTVYEGFYVDEPNAEQNGAPGVFHTGDVNNDGLMDVSTSGDGDDGLYLFKQELDGSFQVNLIDTGTIMAGDHHMTDIDGDGDMDFIWAIYGDLDILGGQLEPSSQVNLYIQGDEGISSGSSTGSGYTGAVDFTINTSFGPDSCNGTVSLELSGSEVSGSYSCNFLILGAQTHSITGTVDSNGNISGELDLTVSFSGSTYSLPWTGSSDGVRITSSTNSTADLDGMAIDYTMNFVAE